jgi:probable H4MPT-linked C1 transfer pathway protein
MRIAGWDVGGAHLKAALVQDGRVLEVFQEPAPIWNGIHLLHEALGRIIPRLGAVSRHCVTMTGELADIFASRAEGVAALAAILADAAAPAPVRLYAGRAGFVAPEDAGAHALDIASANWHASAALLARSLPDALLIDMGSTTTDIVPLCDSNVAAAGYTDAERLARGELLYTGLTRAHPMSLGPRAPFAGGWSTLANEYFATMADARRVLGDLPEGADQMKPIDGRGVSVAESRARLARILGRDAADAPDRAWRRFAAWLTETQLRQMTDCAYQVLSREILPENVPVIGAGIGVALIEQTAARLGLPYRSYAAAIGYETPPAWLTHCAPAAAVALLATAHG